MIVDSRSGDVAPPGFESLDNLAAPITWRLGTPDDALCVGVLGLQVFLDTYAIFGVRPGLAREALESFSTAATADLLSRPGTVVVLAERTGHLLGFAQFHLDKAHDQVPADRAGPRPAELRRLYVQERATGQGLGRALLARGEAAVRDRGATSVWLTAYVGNARALAFYPRCGYDDLGVTTYTFQAETYENRLFGRALR